MAARHRGRRSVSEAYSGVPKVPAVKPYFWVVKLLTTAMGEAMSDFVVLDVNKYLGVILGFLVFLVAIWWQFRTPRYGTWPYWTAVAMVAVFGTMAADVMHVVLGLPYLVSAVFYAVCLVVTFAVWYRSEGTLDIHSIVTRRREVFYWLAVIFTFAMGTALGDLFATTFALGFLPSAFVFTGLICLPLVAWRLGANPVLTFWVAYILTRPIGASFADFFGMPKDVSGMGFGHGPVSLVTLVMVLAFFGYMSRSGIDQPEVAESTATVPVGYRQPQQGQPPHGQPQYAGTPYGEPRQAQPHQYGQPQYGQPQRGGFQYGQPQYGQPEYGAPRYGDPGQAQPQYGDPRYGQPQQGQPQHGRFQHDQPRHGQPQYSPWYGDDPRQDQPQYGDYGQPQYPDPRYAEPQPGDPRSAGDPGFGDPRRGGHREHRSS